MGEAWKPIPNWEGYYEVSNQGNVRSVDRVIIHPTFNAPTRIKGVRLKKFANDKGYLCFHASRNGKYRRVWIHRAVLEAFVELKPAGAVCMHLNNDPADNRLENLRWGTQQENIRQCVEDGRQVNAKKTHCPRGHKLVEPNLVPYHLKRGKRACYSCNWASQRFGVKRSGEDVIQRISDERYSLLDL